MTLDRFLESVGKTLLKVVGLLLGLVFSWGIGFWLADYFTSGYSGVYWLIVFVWFFLSIVIFIAFAQAVEWLFGRLDAEAEADKKAFDAKVLAILRNRSLEPEEMAAALEALGPPEDRIVSRWTKFWDRLRRKDAKERERLVRAAKFNETMNDWLRRQQEAGENAPPVKQEQAPPPKDISI